MATQEEILDYWQQHIEAAQERIAPYIRETPLEYAPYLSRLTGVEVWLKMENWQVSGSFKIRGVFNKLLSVPEATRKSALFVAVSTGNHASAFAYACNLLGLNGKIFLPTTVASAKLQYIQSFGIPYELYGRESLETELYAGEYARKHGAVLVHPYNDPDIVAGQGTIAPELLRAHSSLDAVFIPVGGGGLASGIATYLSAKAPEVARIGCQPENSPEMQVSIRKGSIITESITKPTLSDGTAGGIEPGSITFELCRDYLHDILLLSEKELRQALHWMLANHQQMIEGAAANSLAALFQQQGQWKGKQVALVLSGKRLSMDKLKKVVLPSWMSRWI